MTETSIVPVKRLLQGKVTDGPHETPNFTDEGVPFLSVDGIQNGKLKFDGCRYISPEDADVYRKKCDPSYGDILLGKAASVGKVAYVDVNFTFSVWSPLALLRPKKDKLNGKFLYYCLQSKPVQRQIFLLSNFNTQLNIGMRDIENLCIPNLTADRQDEIASFLDRKTTAIDTLIAKKQRLIQLLEEKRAALINQAVTKGLNPNAPMKDSGIPWISEIPEHWKVLKLGFFAEVTKLTGFEYTNHWSVDPDGEIIALRGFNVKNGKLNLKNVEKITTELSNRLFRSKLFAGDIVFPCTGTVGNGALIEESNKYHINQNIAKITVRQQWNIPQRYLLHQLCSHGMKYQIDSFNSSGLQPVLLIGTIRNLACVLPSNDEQKEIAEYVDRQNQKLDGIVLKLTSQIEKLQEYRQSLITAAVTGKLEVEVDEAA